MREATASWCVVHCCWSSPHQGYSAGLRTRVVPRIFSCVLHVSAQNMLRLSHEGASPARNLSCSSQCCRRGGRFTRFLYVRGRRAREGKCEEWETRWGVGGWWIFLLFVDVSLDFWIRMSLSIPKHVQSCAGVERTWGCLGERPSVPRWMECLLKVYEGFPNCGRWAEANIRCLDQGDRNGYPSSCEREEPISLWADRNCFQSLRLLRLGPWMQVIIVNYSYFRLQR